MALSLEQPGKSTVAPLSRREFGDLTRRGVLDDARVELLYGWIVNLVEGVFEVHAGPSGEGYARVTRHGRGSTLRVPQLADLEVAVSDVLPPQR